MKQKIISNPKVTQPSLLKVFLRKRLFRLIDLNRAKPVVWVAAPGGSGKTTLIASYLQTRRLPCLWYQIDKGDADIASFFYYMGMAAQAASRRKQKPLPFLTPEHLSDITTFTKRYFEKLFAMLKPPFCLVFDNYQDAPAESMLHEVIKEGLSLIPDKINVIIISRSEPLQELSRLRVSERLGLIRWNDIRFTFEESKKVARMKEKKSLSDKLIEQIHKKTEGWIAGLILALEDLKTRDIDTQALEKVAQDEIFDYFASEIFDRTDADVQQFLLKTAFLPKMTIPVVERLTGLGIAEQILTYLNKNQYFIANRLQTEPVYEYHQLFRGFLLNRAKRMLSAEELSNIQRRAAEILEGAGQSEDAIVLYTLSGDRTSMARVILANAQAMIMQGRSKTLEEWIKQLPQTVVDETPWLLYWLGICRMPFNLSEARTHLESAFEAFKKNNERIGQLLAWSAVVENFIYEWSDFHTLDHWIAELDAILAQDCKFPSIEVEARVSIGMFLSLIYRQPQHPDLSMWTERVEHLVALSPDISVRFLIGVHLLLYYAWWSGEFAKGTNLINMLAPIARTSELSPLARIAWHATQAAYYWMTAENAASLQAVEEGLKIAEATGVHVWDFMLVAQGGWARITSNDFAGASASLKKLSEIIDQRRFLDVTHYHHQAFYEAYYRQDVVMMMEHAEASLSAVRKAGVPWAEGHVLGTVMLAELARGNHAAVDSLLHQIKAIAKQVRCYILEFVLIRSKSVIAIERAEETDFLPILQELFAGTRAHNMLNGTNWTGQPLLRVCIIALEHGIEVDYVKHLIKKRNLLPPADSPLPDNWPYPVKLYTFGRFEIFKDNKRIEQGRKAQKKPMDLLKMIIALGGQDIQDGQIIDALWPDTEGDAAWRAFATTLHRLRKLIGSDKAILWRDGIITIDRQYCYVDAWAFQEHIKMADEAIQSGRQKQAANLLEKAIGLYRGLFLSGDEKLLPAASFGAKLKNKFVRAIGMLGQVYEDMGEFKKAVDAYNKGISVDELDEGFYQSLMLCYKRMGLRSEAIKAYNQFKTILSHSLQIEPSLETQNIYKTLIS